MVGCCILVDKNNITSSFLVYTMKKAITHLGFCDTSASGSGIIWLHPYMFYESILWCHPWSPKITSSVLLKTNSKVLTKNFNLNIYTLVLCESTLLVEIPSAPIYTPHLGSNSMPTIYWRLKESNNFMADDS